MKFVKYLFSIIIIFCVGAAVWFYYPQYQIHKMKKQSVEAASKKTADISYISYFRHSNISLIHHLAIGDSVIHGVGADQNQNLVSQFSTQLEEQTSKQVQFQNEGINGITSKELNEMVQAGKFDNEIKQADIVTVNVGGNDILQTAKGQNFQNAVHAFGKLQTDFSKNLTDIATRIQRLNPKATIVFLELYNPLPSDNKWYSLANQLLPKWNLNIYETADKFPLSVVVETTKVINGENRQNLSPDGVHPSPKGYDAISKQMIIQLKHQYRKNAV